MPLFAERLRHRSSEISLAEHLEVAHLLAPRDAATEAAMLRYLGLGKEAEEGLGENEEQGGEAKKVPSPPPDEPLPVESSPPVPPPESPRPRKLPVGVRLLEPERVDPVSVELLVGRPLAGDVAVLARDRPAHLQPPPCIPLLAPRWFPAVARALLASLAPTAEIDLAYVEKRLIAGRPLEWLPWRHRRTFRRGVQVLVDHSESMQPFWRDSSELITRLQRLLGSPSVHCRYFRMNRWGAPGRRWTWLSRGPAEFQANRPLLIVSDFGVSNGEGVEPEAWLEMLQPARDQRCPLLALVPAPEIDWPWWLRQIIPRAFTWDRTTSPHTAQRRVDRVGVLGFYGREAHEK